MTVQALGIGFQVRQQILGCPSGLVINQVCGSWRNYSKFSGGGGLIYYLQVVGQILTGKYSWIPNFSRFFSSLIPSYLLPLEIAGPLSSAPRGWFLVAPDRLCQSVTYKPAIVRSSFYSRHSSSSCCCSYCSVSE